MMNSRLITAVFLAAFLGAALGAAPAPGGEQELVIYAYDSFVSEWGPAGKVLPKFESQTGARVKVLSAGDAGQVLARVIVEKGRPQADLALGIDNNLLARALEEKVFEPYASPNLKLVPPELRFDPTHSVTPFDYGYFAAVSYTHLTLPTIYSV